MYFPSRFTWKENVKQWSMRQNQNPGMKQESIGRLPPLTPAHSDVFYLRSLLCHEHCKGKKSYEDLRTYQGHIQLLERYVLNLGCLEMIWNGEDV